MVDLVSVAGGGELGVEIDQSALAEDLDLPIVRYEPESYAGLYARFEEEGATIMAFRSGKYNIAGASSVEELETTHERFIEAIEDRLDTGLDSARDTLQLRNLVYIDRVEQEVDLSVLFEIMGSDHAAYEPEQFPALDYRPPDQEGLFKVFSNGKISLTGTTDPNSVEERFERVREYIRQANQQRI